MKKPTKSRINRWRRAQLGESSSWAHKQVWPKRVIGPFFRETFGVDPETFLESTILEVGSGSGGIHNFPTDAFLVGLDPLNIELRPVTEGSNARLVNGAGESMPFDNAIFDYCFCLNVLDHVLDPQIVIREIQRVLKPHGKLLFTMNIYNLPAPALRVLDSVDRLHPHHFSRLDIESLFESEGFEIGYLSTNPFEISGLNAGIKAIFKSAMAKSLFAQEIALIASPA